MFQKNKKIIGLTENVVVIGKKQKTVVARIDTGAELSAIDSNLAAGLELGPIVKTKTVRSTHGKTVRPVVKAQIILAGKKVMGYFTLADRAHMRYQMLIGQNILCENGFLIDPSKK